MKHVIKDHWVLLSKAGEIPISQSLHEQLGRLPIADVGNLLQHLRLDLQSRITGLDNERDLLKLQGKLDYLGEFEAFFLNLLK